jgi:diphthine-ammonia ligase
MDFLHSFFPSPNLRIGALFSTGKDSHFALWLMQRHNYEISCLITLKSKNPDSYMFHTPAIELARLQSTALNIPLLEQETVGEEESELEDLRTALNNAKTRHHIEGVVTGAIASNYQRSRIERLADELGLKIFCPLWHIDQEIELVELLREQFSFIMTSVAAEGLDETWLNTLITPKELERLKILHEKTGLHIAGEGGEYESLVLTAPNYTKKLVIDDYIVQKDGLAARMIIKKAHLE